MDQAYLVPSLADLFGLQGTLCHEADIHTFELVAPFQHQLDTDVTNPNNFPQPENLKTLHGLVIEVNGQCTYQLRTSPVRIHGNDGDWLDQDWHEFLLGLKSDEDIGFDPDDGGTYYTVNWSQGGYSAGRFQSYHDREKMARLFPYFTYKLRNLNGFTWNSVTHRLNFDPDNHLVQGTRYSNGGLIGFNETPVAAKGVQSFYLEEPTLEMDLRPGDIFYHHNFIYTLTGMNGDQVIFEPALRHDAAQGDALSFYRYYNPDVDNQYQGYDAHGNNGYRETYVKNKDSLDWLDNDASRTYYPKFPQAFTNIEADSLHWNDSTDPSNNDTVNWAFFGRIKHAFDSHELRFYDYSARDEIPGSNSLERNGIGFGMVTEYTFNNGINPRKPIVQTAYFQPVEVLAYPFAPTASNHYHDLITEFGYVSPSDAHSLTRGKLKSEKHYLRKDIDGQFSTFTATRIMYDVMGRARTQINASFQDAQDEEGGVYGICTTTIRDGATGLPLNETLNAIDVSVYGNIFTYDNNSQIKKSRDFWEYDRLGRETRKTQQDAAGKLFGAENYTQYLSPYETRILTVNGNTIASPQLNESQAFVDGIGREMVAFSRFGTTTLWDASGQNYDDVGRSDQIFVAKRMNPANLNQKVGDLFGGNAAYTQSRYNGRGEAVGRVTQTQANHNKVWNLTRQENNLLVRYTFTQELDQDRINLKRQKIDAYGNVEEVGDFVFGSTATNTFTEAEAQAFLDDLLTDSNHFSTPETYAAYKYDRFGNIRLVTAGVNQSQTRTFEYDQRGRLRKETHPEMSAGQAPVHYDDFDIHGNPWTVTEACPTGMSCDRTTLYTYDAYGNQLSRVANNANGSETTTYIYRYDLNGSADPWPERLHMVHHLPSTGTGVAYKYGYHPEKGLLTERELIHTAGGWFPGHSSSFTTDSNLAADGDPLVMVYDHDDLGRIKSLTYPSGLPGNDSADSNPITLRYELRCKHRAPGQNSRSVFFPLPGLNHRCSARHRRFGRPLPFPGKPSTG